MSEPANEPVLGYGPSSPERTALREEIGRQSASPRIVCPVVGGEKRLAGVPVSIRAPHSHALLLGESLEASGQDVRDAIQAALEARPAWAATDFEVRAAVFLRAAALLAGPMRQRLNAATLLGQSKTPHQAEIDAACELIDFLRFNVHFARRMLEESLISPPGEKNRLDWRPLEGFVYAVTPFNFTSIAANLPIAPALLGNVVVWKPSPYALLSAHHVFELLRRAGLPDGVINFVPGDAETVTREVLDHPAFAALNFTGSTAVFRSLFRKVGERIDGYRTIPRLVGETGGKNFVIAHESADLDALATAVVRGGFEFQGQKCSAASRVYLPRSLVGSFEARILEQLSAVRVGDPADFSCFMGALISRPAFARVSGAIERARSDPECRLVFGGGASEEHGFFIEPTVFEVSNSQHALMTEELFGPVVSTFVYQNDRFEEVLSLCDRTSVYGLTGAVFARDRAAIDQACDRLRDTAGNFYVNDKPTGAVVGQQPFGGARLSGTNDKAGSADYLKRWVSARVIKETSHPARDFRYPFLMPDPVS